MGEGEGALCGIVGFVGRRSALPVLLDGLQRLEYRGYDSAGVALQGRGAALIVCKQAGRVAALAAAVATWPEAGDGRGATTGIGHTRWATHGAPNDANAHPHVDERLRVAVVHNGIIENHAELRQELAARGHIFRSETDSEVIAHLLDEQLDRDVAETAGNGRGEGCGKMAPTGRCQGGGWGGRSGGGWDGATTGSGRSTTGLASPLAILPRPATDAGTAADLLRQAVQRAVARLRGSFALVAMAHDAPDVLIGVRQHTPLIIGLGDGEQYLASDITALLPYTRRVLALRDGELAAVGADGLQLFDFTGATLPMRAAEAVTWDATAAERGGYAHFMLKEIHEQPEALSAALRGRCTAGPVVLPELEAAAGGAEARAVRAARGAVLLGCGTAYHAGLVGATLLARWAGLPAHAELASEFRYREPLIAPDTLAIAVSQSGETADTLGALREARARGATTIAVVNVVGSTIAREADIAIYTRAGPEIAVASTKAYTTQIAVLALLAQWAAQNRPASGQPESSSSRGPVTDPTQRAAAPLAALPTCVTRALRLETQVRQVAERLAGHDHAFFIGRGLDWATAIEAQLKLKEVSYLHAEAYAAGELKHGALALVTSGTPVVAICTQPHLVEKTASNIAEVRARGAWVIGLAVEGLGHHLQPLCDTLLLLPAVPADLAPVVAAVPLQLLAYHTAVARGTDVDRPRNLAKSVTVE